MFTFQASSAAYNGSGVGLVPSSVQPVNLPPGPNPFAFRTFDYCCVSEIGRERGERDRLEENGSKAKPI